MKKLTLLILILSVLLCACHNTATPTQSAFLPGETGTLQATSSTSSTSSTEITTAPTAAPLQTLYPSAAAGSSLQQQVIFASIVAKNNTPEVVEMPQYAPRGVYSHIKAVWFRGMDKGNKKTKVFAYIGFPEGASSSNKVPAVVLLHGLGGNAFLEWVRLWNQRGYAAIAIHHEGGFPTRFNAGFTETDDRWMKALPAELKDPEYVSVYESVPNELTMSKDIRYHGVCQSILAFNILKADERVDGDKIGICGISIGGTLASAVIGLDNRFAFAIPIYGSVIQGLDWGAYSNLASASMPILWLNWNDDNFFPVTLTNASYTLTRKKNKNTLMALADTMYHSHAHAWRREEPYAFADSVTKGGDKLASFLTQPQGRNINVIVTTPQSASQIDATLYYIDQYPSYSNHFKYGYEAYFMDQVWKTQKLDYSSERITGTVPEQAVMYYIEIKTLIGINRLVTSSELITL